jgi:hypothetical protein
MLDLSFLLSDGLNLADNLISAWDDTWSRVLGVSVTGFVLYGILCWIGTLLAVVTLLVLMFELFNDLNKGRMEAFTQLIWPLVVALLLAHNGRLLAQITLDIRGIINQINNMALGALVVGVSLDEIFRQALAYISLESTISNWLRPCESLFGEAQSQCLNQAISQSQGFVNSAGSVLGGASWLTDLTNSLGTIGNRIGDGNFQGVLQALTPGWLPVVASMLTYSQMAYQQTLEASLLLTALFGPIAVGASLLPNGTKAMVVWVTTLFSIGFARLAFNILVGLTSIIVTSSPGGNPFWFSLFSGLFAPVLSSLVAGGTGFGIVNATRQIPSFNSPFRW